MIESSASQRKTTLRAAALCLSALMFPALAAYAQATPVQPPKPMAADADPAFEVAAIKPTPPDTADSGFRLQNLSFSCHNLSVADLLVFSFGLNSQQIVGGPDWLRKEKFDITARPDTEGQPTREQYGIMVRKLLADRFKLSFHHESRELAAYLIEIGKGGSKLKPHIPAEAPPGHLNMQFRKGGVLLDARNETMAEFALALQQAAFDQPVLNHTGLPGRFDFQFAFSPEGTRLANVHLPPSNDEPAPGIFSAVQDLGLKLEAVKTSVDVLVIDQAEHPSEN